MTKNYFMSAGDISGDFHASNLVKSLKTLDPEISITAVGGKNLLNVSTNFLSNICSLSGFGFFAPFRLYFLLRKIFKMIKLDWDKNKPEKIILVDYYGFNIHLAKEAFKRNIPVYYFISPQIWASRKRRIRKLKKYVKKMLVILPFEEEIYRKAGLDCVFVGHPLLDLIAENDNKDLSGAIPLIGLFPGSRSSVFDRHMPILEKTAEIINNKIQANFKIFVTDPSDFRCPCKYPLVKSDNFAERAKLTLAITTSGTVSLENALLGIPMLIYYKLSGFNYFLAKLLVKIKYIGMPNILSGREIVPELIQSQATPEKISDKAVSMLKDKDYLNSVKKELANLKNRLGSPGATLRAAKLILEG